METNSKAPMCASLKRIRPKGKERNPSENKDKVKERGPLCSGNIQIESCAGLVQSCINSASERHSMTPIVGNT